MALVQGIDTGTWRVRVSTMTGSFRRFVLRDVMEMEASVGAGEALEAISGHEPQWAQAERVAALPLDVGAVRLVKLPFTDRATIQKALPAEVESAVPYDLEDMILETRLIDTEKGHSRTRVVIAPKEAVAALLETLRRAGAEPRSIVLDADVLASYADRGVQAIVDVGHSRTVLCLCQGGQLLAARLVPLAGKHITEAIAAACAIGFSEAEALKHKSSVPMATSSSSGWSDAEPTDAERRIAAGSPVAEAALLGAVDDILREIRSRLIALEDELGVGVDEVLLAGGTTQLEGFGNRLSMAVGVPARNVLVPGGHPAACALSVALARVAAEEVRAIDLRVGAYAYRGHAAILWSVAGYGALATAAILVVGMAVFGWRVGQLWDRLAELDDKVIEVVTSNFADVDPDRLSDSSMALAIFQEKAGETQSRVDALGATVSGEPPLLSMLRELSNALPPNKEARIDVRELTITDEAMSLKAETDSFETAAKIEMALKATTLFSQARKSDEKKAGEALTFNVSIPLGAPEGEEVPSPAPALPGTEG